MVAKRLLILIAPPAQGELLMLGKRAYEHRGEHAVRTTGHGAMRSIARPGWGFAKLHCPDRMSGLKFSKAEIYKIYLAAAIVFYNQHHNSLNSVEKI